jgi:hypothetical protein
MLTIGVKKQLKLLGDNRFLNLFTAVRNELTPGSGLLNFATIAMSRAGRHHEKKADS